MNAPGETEAGTKIYLLKIGELVLKGGNRAVFEKRLAANINCALNGRKAGIIRKDGRFFLQCAEKDSSFVEAALSSLAGITGWAAVRVSEKTPPAVLSACVKEAGLCFEGGARSFKIEARRTDKSFPLDSYGICREAGGAVLGAFPGFKVDVRRPDAVINVEIREKAFVYGKGRAGLRGLPVGTGGRGMLLLSGGIDSPVAGFLMLLRGLGLNAVYFHAYPYTSDEAKQKVIALAGILRRTAPKLGLFIASVTEIEKRIRSGSRDMWRTVMLRMAMMEIASELALKSNCKCLITGESLAQVASQTIENIICAESAAKLPVLRPLIGMDKEDIIKKSRSIGAYETSILRHNDCCAIFSPEHPVIHSDKAEAQAIYRSLELESMIKTSAETAEFIKI